MNPDYDVIIIGAGPAGTLTAKLCAEKGLKVLVLEKRAEIGAPKRCAEAIDSYYFKMYGYTGKEPYIRQIITDAVLCTPDNNSIIVPMEDVGYILERKLYDKYLAYEAAMAGAKIRTKCDVIGLVRTDGKISGVRIIYDGTEKEIYCRIVVSAEGVESKIACMAGLVTKNTYHTLASGYQYEMAGIALDSPHRYYFYVGNDIAPAGYIWIFPKGDHIANVGIGISGNCEKTAKYYLDKWIESQPGIRKGSIIEENAGGVPIGGFLEKMTTDNFLAIGDAAHQVNPLHGGGLAESLHSSKIASEVIHDAISHGDTSDTCLNRYNTLWWEKRGKSLLKVEKIVKIYEKLNDSELNYIVSCLNGEDLRPLTEGNISILLKIFMKNPRLLTLAKHLK